MSLCNGDFGDDDDDDVDMGLSVSIHVFRFTFCILKLWRYFGDTEGESGHLNSHKQLETLFVRIINSLAFCIYDNFDLNESRKMQILGEFLNGCHDTPEITSTNRYTQFAFTTHLFNSTREGGRPAVEFTHYTDIEEKPGFASAIATII